MLVFILSVTLFVFAPFHAFLITWLRDLGVEEGLGFTLSAWREILLILLFVLALPKIWQGRKTLLKNYGFILIFLLFPFVFLVFQREEFMKWLWGVRVDTALFVSFLIFSFFTFPERHKNWITKVFFGAGLVVTLFGLIHALFLPPDSLVPFGYSVSRDIWDVKTAIASCQPLEHTQKFCRAISSFGGPTRYGTYLLLLLSMGTFGLLQTKIKWQKYFLSFLLLLTLANILLTFSRSIWVALFSMVIAGLVITAKKRSPPLPWKKILIMIASLFLIFLFFTYDSFKIIFLRTSSTSEHLARMKAGIEKMIEHPLGLGLGSAGPASLRFEPLITENWYLQIGVEMGILGLLLFLLALGQLFWRVRLSLPFFLALTGISVAGLFTHSFEETTTVILFGALAGLLQDSKHSPEKDGSPQEK